MNWIARLFTFAGRSGRKAYWFTVLPFSLVGITGVGLAMEAETGGSVVALATGAALLLLALVTNLAVSVRRLHDRGKPGWWLLLYWLVPALFAPSMGQAPTIPVPNEILASMLGLVSLGLSAWALIELGFLKGQPRDNRFGPDPLGRGTAEVFA